MQAARERELQQQEMDQEESTPFGEERTMEERQPIEATAQQPKQEKDFKKTLEEILLGEEFVEAVKPKPVSNERRTIEADDERKSRQVPRRNIFQKYYDDEMLEGSQETIENDPKKLEDRVEELEKEMVLEEDETVEESRDKIDFDLRKAIIYSEIINRRYTN